jgi:hypothetical protein
MYDHETGDPRQAEKSTGPLSPKKLKYYNAQDNRYKNESIAVTGSIS